ncbi:juvenile hormone esterase [Manduca sexta]|uniref:Esterase n=2 Tax=Manduca sexta TaxID=7130 RepID=A0A922CDQ5_MANSE|nr:juvenile hormone esterase [Manduca sexta]KAG6442083.1 hypothetical protein O3G_MSEX002149 [Manduca sexta]KAG6442084.1 hypothetical protein O3G_MSEX002149 [Manduca sexta]UXP72007.1 esterase [Manduca sexta]
MSLRAVAFVLAVLCCARHVKTSSCHDGCQVRVELTSGPICGSVEVAENATHYYSFQGIPYAKPPTGARRFAELEDCDPWVEPLLTIEEGPACPQLDIIYGSIPVQKKGMLEDCMYANVYVPESAHLNCTDNDDEGLPILVNIHGGGYQTGSGNSDLHGPEYLMYKGNVIVMSFNYRLNVFGFLSLDSEKIPGNNGLRDMVKFLKWVQKNARAFGGNPKNVTLIGQSVGSASVHLMTLTKATEGLFQRGIMMSGTAIPMFFSASKTFAKYVADLFLKAAGITATDPDEIHQKLIEMPLNDIMYANSIAQNLTGLTTFVPVVESDHPGVTKILDDEPIELIAKGRGSNIPLIAGFTNNEAVFFRRVAVYLNMLERVRQDNRVVMPLRLAYGLNASEAESIADKIMDYYFSESLDMDKLLNSISNLFFVYPTLKLAQVRSALGAAPLYLYEYSYESKNSMIKRALWEQYQGAAHVEDLTFLFRTNTLMGDYVSFPPKDSDDHMKDWMTDFVLNFIRCNNPTCNNDTSSPWLPADHTHLRLLSIAEPKVYKMTELSDTQKSIVNFYDSVDPHTKALTKTLNIRPV